MSADEGGDTTPMSVANGDHSDLTAIAASGKRKRSTQDDKSNTDSSASASRDRANLHETLRNLIELLLK
jgi:hypothetical protein